MRAKRASQDGFDLRVWVFRSARNYVTSQPYNLKPEVKTSCFRQAQFRVDAAAEIVLQLVIALMGLCTSCVQTARRKEGRQPLAGVWGLGFEA